MTPQPASDVNGSQSDPVHHPKHYNSHPSGVECVEYAELLPGNLSHVCVYVWRHADKGTPAQDLAKALWFLDREIGRTLDERAESASHLVFGLTEALAPSQYRARARIQDRRRHLHSFVKAQEFVACVVSHLLGYQLLEARKLIVLQLKHIATEVIATQE